ncbi:MAG: hypothetical protein ABRQ37_12035 [Candidatus Eremiobacterota bacterium]
MEDIFMRFVNNIICRLDGPLHFRFIFQPLMAVIFAIIDGRKDALHRKTAYLLTVITVPEQRKELLKEGWKSFGKIFIIAIILDIVYQLKVHHTIYPGETLLVAFILAILPYVLLRGMVNRIIRLFKKH